MSVGRDQNVGGPLGARGIGGREGREGRGRDERDGDQEKSRRLR